MSPPLVLQLENLYPADGVAPNVPFPKVTFTFCPFIYTVKLKLILPPVGGFVANLTS
jgi:hypothetical protein